MTTVVDGQTRTTTLHLGTAGGYKLAKVFPDPSDDSSVASAPWKERLDNLRDGFDIDHDLGGLAIDRIWGLVSHRGLVASVATLHPGDMIEYGAPATDATSIAISPARHDGDVLSLLHGGASNRSPRSMRAERERVINFILHVGQGNKDMWSNRLTYAAACCVIVESENEPLRLHAREALENLATAVGVDLSEEISKCSAGPGSMEPKLVEQLNGPGGQLFEKCDVCDAGVAWYSARESQCAAGHLFGRWHLPIEASTNLGSAMQSEFLVNPRARHNKDVFQLRNGVSQ